MLRFFTRAVFVAVLAAIPFTMPHCGGGGGGGGEEPVSGDFCFVIFTEHVGYYLSAPPNGEFLIGLAPCAGSPKTGGLAELHPAITGATVETYPVTGASVAEVGANCTGGTARNGYAAETEMSIGGTYSQTGTAPNGNRQIHIDTVTWTIVVRMPNWTPAPGTPPSEITTYNEIYAELEKHEQGHVDRYNSGMASVRTQAVCQTVEVPANATPAQIEDAVYDAIEGTAAYGEMVTSNENYDAPYDAGTNPTGTNHGTENGQAAWFPG